MYQKTGYKSRMGCGVHTTICFPSYLFQLRNISRSLKTYKEKKFRKQCNF